MSKRMRLVEIRRMRGYSQEYMAQGMNCHRNTYAKMEERPQDVTIREANMLANILGVDVDDIIFLEKTLQDVD